MSEAIREAAKQCGCSSSEAHNPEGGNLKAIEARNIAIVSAYKQGVEKSQLSEGFMRSKSTINGIILSESNKEYSSILLSKKESS